MIVIIDSALGNVRSVCAKIQQMGEEAMTSNAIDDIETADKLVLPGVGAFDTGIQNLRNLGLIPVLQKKIIRERTPILGICLGMQLFTRRSEEGSQDGFGFFDAETVRFDANALHIPHMGWNTIQKKREDPVLSGIENNSRFYFIHSYHVACHHQEDVIATTPYSGDFPSIIRKENVLGVQFHPEKSHKQGIMLLKNFATGKS